MASVAPGGTTLQSPAMASVAPGGANVQSITFAAPGGRADAAKGKAVAKALKVTVQVGYTDVPKRFELVPGETKISIGTGPTNDVQLNFPGVSRLHAELRVQAPSSKAGNPRLVIRDMSTNGTGLQKEGCPLRKLEKGKDTVLTDGSLVFLPWRMLVPPDKTAKELCCMIGACFGESPPKFDADALLATIAPSIGLPMPAVPPGIPSAAAAPAPDVVEVEDLAVANPAPLDTTTVASAAPPHEPAVSSACEQDTSLPSAAAAAAPPATVVTASGDTEEQLQGALEYLLSQCNAEDLMFKPKGERKKKARNKDKGERENRKEVGTQRKRGQKAKEAPVVEVAAAQVAALVPVVAEADRTAQGAAEQQKGQKHAESPPLNEEPKKKKRRKRDKDGARRQEEDQDEAVKKAQEDASVQRMLAEAARRQEERKATEEKEKEQKRREAEEMIKKEEERKRKVAMEVAFHKPAAVADPRKPPVAATANDDEQAPWRRGRRKKGGGAAPGDDTTSKKPKVEVTDAVRASPLWDLGLEQILQQKVEAAAAASAAAEASRAQPPKVTTIPVAVPAPQPQPQPQLQPQPQPATAPMVVPALPQVTDASFNAALRASLESVLKDHPDALRAHGIGPVASSSATAPWQRQVPWSSLAAGAAMVFTPSHQPPPPPTPPPPQPAWGYWQQVRGAGVPPPPPGLPPANAGLYRFGV